MAQGQLLGIRGANYTFYHLLFFYYSLQEKKETEKLNVSLEKEKKKTEREAKKIKAEELKLKNKKRKLTIRNNYNRKKEKCKKSNVLESTNNRTNNTQNEVDNGDFRFEVNKSDFNIFSNSEKLPLNQSLHVKRNLTTAMYEIAGTKSVPLETQNFTNTPLFEQICYSCRYTQSD